MAVGVPPNKFEILMMESEDLVELAEKMWWIGNPHLTEIRTLIFEELKRRNNSEYNPVVYTTPEEEKRKARHEKSRARDDWIVNIGLPRLFKYTFFIVILLSLVMVLTGNEDGF